MGRPKGSKNKKTISVEKSIVESKIIENTAEVIAEQEIKRAEEKGLEDPDFDFRTLYSPGQNIYYAYVNDFDGTKEVQCLIVRTIYARTLIAYEPNGMSRCIGYKEQDLIYDKQVDAEDALKNIKVEAKYKE